MAASAAVKQTCPPETCNEFALFARLPRTKLSRYRSKRLYYILIRRPRRCVSPAHSLPPASQPRVFLQCVSGSRDAVRLQRIWDYATCSARGSHQLHNQHRRVESCVYGSAAAAESALAILYFAVSFRPRACKQVDGHSITLESSAARCDKIITPSNSKAAVHHLYRRRRLC